MFQGLRSLSLGLEKVGKLHKVWSPREMMQEAEGERWVCWEERPHLYGFLAVQHPPPPTTCECLSRLVPESQQCFLFLVVWVGGAGGSSGRDDALLEGLWQGPITRADHGCLPVERRWGIHRG